MRITRRMVNELELLANSALQEQMPFLIAPYMEYPDPTKKYRYVMQWHIRGKSCHTDWRMEVNDHLVGWTVLVPGTVEKTVSTLEEARKIASRHKFEFSSEVKNKGFRAETKARQPKDWLTVEGVTKEGDVGATKQYPGVFLIIDSGEVYFGCQKPYFHEYFIRSSGEGRPFSNKDWTRVVVRAVNVNVIDPETKKPKAGTELMWRVLVPGDQVPYALARGFSKGWVPPKGYIPVPPEWRTGELYEKWEKWVTEKWASGRESSIPVGKEKECSFTVQKLSYMGQVVVRGIPHREWFLRIKQGDRVLSWRAFTDFINFSPVALQFEGEVDPKWFDFSGAVPPNTEYNPTKTLTATMEIVDTGKCSVQKARLGSSEVFQVDFNGKILAGRHIITQEEESVIYTIEKENAKLRSSRFVLQEHEIETEDGLKKHWDLRFADGFEINMFGDPLALEEPGSGVKAVLKKCLDTEKWMNIKEPRTRMTIGDLVTYVTPVDSGPVEIIEASAPYFMSFVFHGDKLSGYFVFANTATHGSVFERAKLPATLKKTGDPLKGDYFEPFNVIKKENWDYFWLEIYDHRLFSRCVEDPLKYLPGLKLPKGVLEVLVCLYPRPGKIHGARVSRVRFSSDWSVSEASKWVKENGLHVWEGEMIREKREDEDAMLARILDHELRKREKSPEAQQLELELKKKKLELINKWLEMNKD